MPNYQKWMLALLFLGFFGFAGGGYFLLYCIVPFEEWLVGTGKVQSDIDAILKYFVYGWVLFGFAVTICFYAFVLRKQRKGTAYVLTGFVAVNAAFVFWALVNTDTAMAALNRGTVQKTSEQFTFGPYPGTEEMKQLKAGGYDGIITLLSPTIVFENKLLKDEIVNGKTAGIDVYSFPMLPWIGDNQKSIDGVLKLVEENPHKRYYVHCYLGKHRVDYIKRLVKGATGVQAEERNVLLDDDFERGFVFADQNEQIIIGPYPTNSEWFDLLRKEIKEVVSFTDPDSDLYEKEKKVALENNIQWTPAADLPFDARDTKKLAGYLLNAGHPVYVHSFRTNEQMTALHLYLKKGVESLNRGELPAGAQIIGGWLAIGTKEPDMQQLSQSGIETVLYHSKSASIKEAYRAAQAIYQKETRVYVHSPAGTPDLQAILSGFEYGYSKELDNTKTESGEIEVVNRKEVFGPALTKQEWETHLIARGVQKVVLVHAASVWTEEQQQAQKALAAEYGLLFETIDMFEGYEKQLLGNLSSDDRTTYVMVPEEFKNMVIGAVSD